ncbi:TadE/TadG family type IV pilus assembly protein [Pelagibius sp.]|uniref:TadE/TadG family type IV pilus assembly protein n=1 Tax=Pelagibius sp. TaxID=1931238 RepID=UPI003B512C7D
MLRLARRLTADKSGNATVEFAALLPILLLLLIGVVEITNLLRLDRKVVAAAQTTADLITQQRSVTNGQITDILRAAELIVEPFPSAPLAVGISAVRFDEDTGAPVMDWQESKNGGTVPNALTLAQNMGAPGEGVVIVRATYSYAPVFFEFVVGQTSIEEVSILRPRRSAFVEGPTPP